MFGLSLIRTKKLHQLQFDRAKSDHAICRAELRRALEGWTKTRARLISAIKTSDDLLAELDEQSEPMILPFDVPSLFVPSVPIVEQITVGDGFYHHVQRDLSEPEALETRPVGQPQRPA